MTITEFDQASRACKASFLKLGFRLNLSGRGHMEKSSITRDFPVAKAVYSLLKDNVSSSFCFPGWNKGRIICQKSQLKRILSGTESSAEDSKSEDLFKLSNTELPIMDTRSSTSDVKRKHSSADSETDARTRAELMTSTV